MAVYPYVCMTVAMWPSLYVQLYVYVYMQVWGSCPHVWLWLRSYLCNCVHEYSCVCLVKCVLVCVPSQERWLQG